MNNYCQKHDYRSLTGYCPHCNQEKLDQEKPEIQEILRRYDEALNKFRNIGKLKRNRTGS